MKGEIVGLVFWACVLGVGGARITSPPTDATKHADEMHTFTCKVEGIGSDELIWERKTRYQNSREKIFDSTSRKTTDEKKFEVLRPFDLIVNKIQLADAGTYYCRLNSGQEESADLAVIVNKMRITGIGVDSGEFSKTTKSCSGKPVYSHGETYVWWFPIADSGYWRTGPESCLCQDCGLFVLYSDDICSASEEGIEVECLPLGYKKIKIADIGVDSGEFTKTTKICSGEPVYTHGETYVWWVSMKYWRTGPESCICQDCGLFILMGHDICSATATDVEVECLEADTGVASVTCTIARETILLQLFAVIFLLQRLL